MTGTQAGSSFGPPILSTHLVFLEAARDSRAVKCGLQLHPDWSNDSALFILARVAIRAAALICDPASEEITMGLPCIKCMTSECLNQAVCAVIRHVFEIDGQGLVANTYQDPSLSRLIGTSGISCLVFI